MYQNAARIARFEYLIRVVHKNVVKINNKNVSKCNSGSLILRFNITPISGKV